MVEAKENANYSCHRASGPLKIDGNLDKEVWARAPRTPRFGAMSSGDLTLFDTRTAALWDDRHLYVAFWLEERDVWSTQEERVGLAWSDNTAEVFIAGQGAYYNLSVNPENRTTEMFVIWKDSYLRNGRYDVPEFDLAVHRPSVLGGDAGKDHPRGMRWVFSHWQFPGLETAVQVDGTLNRRGDIDRGWTVEIAFPWQGMTRLEEDPIPPQGGDVWRIGFARTEVIDQRASRYTAMWAPYPMGESDMHLPEEYPTVTFSPATADG